MLKNIILTTATSLFCLNMACAGPRLDILYHPAIGGNAIYENRLFLPIYNTHDAILFSDVRAVSDFEKISEFNLGLGARKQIPNMDIIVGGYYFYDHREEGRLYRQNTFGGEILSGYLEARGNYYMPFKEEKNVTGDTTITYKDGDPYISKIAKMAFGGYDAEVGFVMPVKGFKMGLYGSLYKFKAGANSFIKGKKVRGEVNLDGILPFGLLAAIGGQYDYNSDPNNRNITLDLKVGIPLGKKSHEDSNMYNSVVRDLHIRVADAIVDSKAAKGTITLPGKTSVTFDKIFFVETLDELKSTLAKSIPKKNVAVILKDDIVLLNAGIKIDPNTDYHVISTEQTFDFTTIEKPEHTFSNKIEENHIVMVPDEESITADDKKNRIFNMTTLKGIEKYSYDGHDTYTQLAVATDTTTLRNALSGNADIVLLDNDIELNQAIITTKSKVILGKGKVTAHVTHEGQDIAKELEFSEKRTITDKTNDLWSGFGAQNFNAGGKIIIDGVNLDLKSTIFLNKNASLMVKNSVINANRGTDKYKAIIDYNNQESGDLNDSISLENTVINKKFSDSHSTIVGAENDLSKFAINFKDVTIDFQKDGKNVLVSAPHVTVEGALRVKNKGDVIWDKYNSYHSALRPNVTFKKNAVIFSNNVRAYGNDTAKDITITATENKSPLNGVKIDNTLGSTIKNKIPQTTN